MTWVDANRNRWAYTNEWPEGHRLCVDCDVIKPYEEFHKHSRCKGGYNSVCKACRKAVSKKQYRTHSTQYKLWYRAKQRAKIKGVPFDITQDEIVIPERCPVFNTVFTENTEYAASLDRVIPHLGYVKGNIQVISLRANVIKNNATVDELRKVLEYMCDISQL